MSEFSIGTIPDATLIIITLLAILLAGCVAALEVALSHLSSATAEDLEEEGRRNATRLVNLLRRRERTRFALRGLRTFLQGVSAVSLTMVMVSLPLRWWASALISVVVVSLLQFTIVALIAGRVGERNTERIALACAGWATRVVQASALVNPVIRAMRSWLPQPKQTEAEVRQEMAEDLREMVDRVGETEGIEDEDREMLRSVFELGHTLVREVMVPRTDIVAINADTPARKALSLFVRSGFSRVPVIGNEIDEVRGILFFKDVVQRVVTYGDNVQMVAEQMMRPAEFTPEMKPADDLLRQMQEEHFHMALVVDEYGGISGLVTLEDIVEEVVGELTDEHDRHVIEPVEVAPGVWRIPSRFPIDELGELLDRELEDEDVDSVGGLLGKALGRVPLPGARGQALGVYMVAEEARGRRRQVGTVLCALTEEAVQSAAAKSSEEEPTLDAAAHEEKKP